jgi:hypothetical protein
MIALTTAVACGKKVEAVPTPVNPQITDAVTQAAPSVIATDAGGVSVECSPTFVGPRQPTTVCPPPVAASETLESSPDHPTTEVLQSRVEKAPVCSPVK